MKLGFDLDEVIVALCDVLLKYLNEEFDLSWTMDNFICHSLNRNVYHEDKDIDDKIKVRAIEIVNDPDIQLSAKPCKGAPSFIRKLRKEGHSIHIITARQIGTEENTMKWLRKYKIPFNSIHHVGINGEKGFLGRVLNLDFYVDDNEKHLESMYRYKKRWAKGLVLMTRPWNVDSYDASRFVRVDNWKALRRHLGIHKR
jgi:uncharacterized protein